MEVGKARVVSFLYTETKNVTKAVEGVIKQALFSRLGAHITESFATWTLMYL